MNTIFKTDGALAYFIVTAIDPAYLEALEDLEFLPFEEGYARTFPSDSLHLVRSYENFALYAEELILQTARIQPVPWEQALLALLEKIQGHKIDWWLVGSTALAVRGLDVAPRDIDLSVADKDAHRLGDLLLDNLIEPVQPTPDWFCNWFGRAFLHARVEWVGGVDERADTPEVSDFGPTAASRKETVVWHGHQIQVPPLDMQLRASEARGMTGRVEKIKRLLENRNAS
jgi:hypothetical protein